MVSREKISIYKQRGCAVICLLPVLYAIWIGYTSFLGMRQALRGAEVKNKFKGVTLALHRYHDTYECFPPAIVRDEDGKPMHSWRVLLLPHFEQPEFDQIYEAYNFSEPWNGPQNAKLMKRHPKLGCYNHSWGKRGSTNILVVTGTNTCWPLDGCVRIRDIEDRTVNTILIVEASKSGIHWMEPRDFRIDQMPFTINGKEGGGISSSWNPDGAEVSMAGGFGNFLLNTISADDLKQLLITNDGSPQDFGY